MATSHRSGNAAIVELVPGTPAEFEGYPSPLRAAAAGNARVSAMLYALEAIAPMLEGCCSNADVFPLATAIQACVESARRASDTVTAGIDVTIKAGGASHV